MCEFVDAFTFAVKANICDKHYSSKHQGGQRGRPTLYLVNG